MEEVKVAKKHVNQPFKQDKGRSKKENGKENKLSKLQFQNYTPLNTSLCKIFDNVKAMELLNMTKRKNPTMKPLNAKKYCKYHIN